MYFCFECILIYKIKQNILNFRDKELQVFLGSVVADDVYKSRYFDDPTTMGFRIEFMDGPASPLFNESSVGESAIRYLRSIGENTRAAKLKAFKRILFDVTRKYPYFYQQIDGISDIYKFEKKTPYQPKNITITTLESIDLKISHIISYYMDAYFDMEYRRELIPDNLRWFECTITISEIRRFRTFVLNYNQGRQKDSMGMVSANDDMSFYKIRMRECEFDMSSSMPYMNSLKSSTPEMADNKLSFVTGRYDMSSRLTLIDLYKLVSAEPYNNDNPLNVGSQLDVSENSVGYLEPPDKPSLLSGLIKSGADVIGGVVNTVATIAESKGREFLQENDPINIAKGYVYDKLDELNSKLVTAITKKDVDNNYGGTLNKNLQVENNMSLPNGIRSINVDNQNATTNLNQQLAVDNTKPTNVPSIKDVNNLPKKPLDVIDRDTDNTSPADKDISSINVSNQIQTSIKASVDVINPIGGYGIDGNIQVDNTDGQYQESPNVLVDNDYVADIPTRKISVENTKPISRFIPIDVSIDDTKPLNVVEIDVSNQMDTDRFKRMSIDVYNASISNKSFIPKDVENTHESKINNKIDIINSSDGDYNRSVEVENTDSTKQKFDQIAVDNAIEGIIRDNIPSIYTNGQNVK